MAGGATLFGVSFALGTFFAGVIVSESDFSHEAATNAPPLQDAFAVLFFVSVGMLFDPSILVRQPLEVLAVVLIILVGKAVASLAIVLGFHYPLHTALTISASLAQIGEFSFILAAVGVSLGLLPVAAQSLIVVGALLSITLNPFVFRGVEPLERWLRRRPRLASALERPAGALAQLPTGVDATTLRNHAVIVGHGRVGAPIATELSLHGVPYVVVEQSRERAEALRARGLPVIYGARRARRCSPTHTSRRRGSSSSPRPTPIRRAPSWPSRGGSTRTSRSSCARITTRSARSSRGMARPGRSSASASSPSAWRATPCAGSACRTT